MEKRAILKSILTGKVSEQEARQKLTDSIYDFDLLTQSEYTAYCNIAEKVSQRGYESLTDHELNLCVLLCHKVESDTPTDSILNDYDLTGLSPTQTQHLSVTISYRSKKS